MAQPADEFETASNRAALAGLDSLDGTEVDNDNTKEPEGEADFLELARDAISIGSTHVESGYRSRWNNAYRAFANQHYINSKYTNSRWKGRSKLFRPKTRSMVRRNDATAASALFATADAVQIAPENDADELQLASAKAKHELLNYRLDRQSGKAGLPWFLVAIGARQDATLTGLSISKQYWEYTTKTITVTKPTINPDTGEMSEDEMGEVILREEKEERVMRDRPMVRVYPIDQVIRDPAGNWLNQAQDSAFILLNHPMRRYELEAWISGRTTQGAVKFREDIDINSLRSSENTVDQQGTRYAREGEVGEDRYANTRKKGNGPFDTIWVYECFIRKGGADYHYWYADNTLLSDPIDVEEAYPHMLGDRPIVVGYGSLESHKIDPLSVAMSLQPLQQEANDITNLRLDNVKQTMSPITLVKRGAQVNATQVQNRGADTVLFVNDPQEDVQFDRPPDVAGSAYAEMDRINADFDDLAGTFSGSSVNTNRNLNETVGGMKMLQGDANSVAEFDLRVWTETWVEPVLRQIVKLEEFYETDEKVLAIAGRKAKLQKIGEDTMTDEMLAAEVSVRVNAGLGSTNPMDRIQKLQMAGETLGMLLGPDLALRANQDAFIEEVMGALGYKDASERFFGEEGEDPKVQELMQAIEGLKKQLEDKTAELQNKIDVAQISAGANILEQVIENEAKKEQMQEQAKINNLEKPIDAFLQSAMETDSSERGHKQEMFGESFRNQLGERSAQAAHERQKETDRANRSADGTGKQ